MKKYRIKIVTFKSKRQEFTPQVRTTFLLGLFGYWSGLTFEGEASAIQFEQDNREEALRRIDKHRHGNTRVHTIEFEYIDE